MSVAPQHIVRALGRGEVEQVRAWLEAGGDASALSERGTAMIAIAACTGGAAMMRLLLTAARPANAGYADEDGWTALHAAAGSLYTDRSEPAAVALLCDFGADVNARMFTSIENDEDGEPYYNEPNPPTPLMVAADYGLSSEIVRVLLSRGADVRAMNAADETAEDYARATLDRPVIASIEAARNLYGYESVAEAIRYWDDLDDPWRLNGEAESIIELLSDVRAAGSWKRYVGAWRVELLLLQRLSATGRAFPRAELMERLVALPPPLVGKVASYWRTARDPLY
jgi:ankyrin repeat protein